MASEPLIIERIYNAPAEKVWKAITDKNDMHQWYFDIDDFKPEPGFEFQFRGHDKGVTFLHLCKITEVIPLKKISHTWTYDKYPGNSTVSFELFNEGEKTKLRLTHTGLETFPQDNSSFSRESFTMGWTEIIGKMLKNFVEK
jgi:uncharacterized protein YndB with AHSA1/START domain